MKRKGAHMPMTSPPDTARGTIGTIGTTGQRSKSFGIASPRNVRQHQSSSQGGSTKGYIGRSEARAHHPIVVNGQDKLGRHDHQAHYDAAMLAGIMTKADLTVSHRSLT